MQPPHRGNSACAVTEMPSASDSIGAAATLALALGGSYAVGAGMIPDPAVGWAEQPSLATSLAAAGVCFVFTFAIEHAAKAALGAWRHPLARGSRDRSLLARHAMDVAALAYIGWLGVCCYRELDPDLTACVTSKRGGALVRSPAGCIPASAHERLYVYLPRVQWLCVVFLAFQAKNLLDSWVWADGPEFLAHHVVCIFVAAGCLTDPPFLHLYCIFFFGLSEISTALVAALAAFDDRLGVPQLGDYFPTAKVVVGLSFTLLFVALRVVAWPLLAYYGVYRDCQQVLSEGTAHSPPVVIAYLVCLFGVSLLQLVWLGEICRRAPAEVRAALAKR